MGYKKHGAKKPGAKNRVIVIQKEKRPGFLNNNDPVFCTLLFETHILDPKNISGRTDKMQ